MRNKIGPPDPNDGLIVWRKPPAESASGEQGYGYELYDDAAEGSGLLEYWHILKRRKGTLILAAFLGGALALLYTLPQTPIYQATASIEIQHVNPQFMDQGQLNPVREASISYNNNDIQTQISVIQSRVLFKRAMEELRKTRPSDYSLETGRVSAWRRALNLPQPEPEDGWESALFMAAGSTRVRAEGTTRIVAISADSTDPRMAAGFANTLANEYIEQNMESRWQMTQQTGAWLTRQLEEMRISLEESEENLNDYARRAGLLYTDAQGSVSDEKLSQIQAALSQAQTRRAAMQSRYELVSTSTPEALPDVLNDSTLRDYQRELTGLRRQEAELATTYTPEHVSRKRVWAQIDSVERALAAERDAIIERIRNDYTEALMLEKLLKEDYAEQSDLVTDQAAKSVQYNILKREVESNRDLYETMLQRLKSASVASALRASNVRVVDPAVVPEAPYKPQAMRNALLGVFLGGFLGIAFVIVRERMDHTLQDPGDVRFYLNVPELGVIPSAEKKAALRIRYRSKDWNPPRLASGEKKDGAGSKCVELVTWQRQPSPIAESFRAALTSILFSGSGGFQPRVLTVTSASPSEGKTTVTCNLAIAMAEVSGRVLLIDGDLRKPRVHDIFGVAKESGLSDILKDRKPIGAELLGGSVQPTSVENLFVLPSGGESHSSTNLLYSERMNELLQLLERDFDMVLIDSPPMHQMPDARILGRMSDAVIMVVRSGQTTRDEALAARERITGDGTRILGAVLNSYNPKNSKGGAYRYSYYDRYYRHEESVRG